MLRMCYDEIVFVVIYISSMWERERERERERAFRFKSSTLSYDLCKKFLKNKIIILQICHQTTFKEQLMMMIVSLL